MLRIEIFYVIIMLTAALAQRVRALVPQAEGWALNLSRDRPQSLKQVVTALLLSTRQ